jgi:poly-gamma-glutamate synthase PgsB/CapB
MLVLLLACLLFILALGLWEAHAHRRVLSTIPVRIHVNGTRGKSSVTRLLSGALREAGLITCAKTTGTLARFITPAGREYPIYRPAGANVGEQVRIVRTAAGYAPDVLVIECMALQPSYQWMSEKMFVRATHGVITNARPDHLDVMGPGPEDVSLALSGMVPRGGKLFTCEREHAAPMKQACLDRGSEFVGTTPDDVAAITEEDLAGFPYQEHAENVALVLSICADLNIDRETALRGMYTAPPDVGVLKEYQIDYFGRKLFFVNAFAANDPVSTGRIWEGAVAKRPGVMRIALFNCRADRPDRSFGLGEACLEWSDADLYLLIGSGTHAFARAAMRNGLDSEKIHYADGKNASQIFETMLSVSGRSALIVGMGNIGGPGLELLQMVKNRCAPEQAPTAAIL